MIKKIIAGLIIGTSILSANNAQININNDTLGLEGEYGINEIYDLSSDAKYYFTLASLNSESKDNKYRSTERILNFGFKMMNPYINDNGLSLGLGVNAVWINNYTKSFTAVPLSVFADYSIGEKVSINTNISYAPKVLAFSSAKSYQEITTKVNYKVIDNGFAYIGYRNIKTKYNDNQTIKFDDNLFFGYKVQF